MDIKDYIDTSRFCKGDPFLDFMYQDIYAEMCANDSDFPILKTCYTTERTCEFIVFDKKEYIIYDQYIGQTLNMFNRIFYNSSHKSDAIVYAYKYFAEIYHYMGNDKMAALCACAFAVNREDMKSFKKEADLENRLRTTLLQEKFILLHEIYHWRFSRFSAEKKEFLILQKRLEISFDFLYEELNAKELAAYILNDALKVFSDDKKSELIASEQDVEILAARLEEDKEEKNKLLLEAIYKRDDLIEEILCDEYALRQLVKFEENTSFSEIFCCTYIGIESLQTMTSMRIYAMRKHNKISQSTLDAAVRKMAYRTCTARSIVKINFEELHKRASEINIHFSEIIRDPILFAATSNLEDISKLKVTEDEISELDEVIYRL